MIVYLDSNVVLSFVLNQTPALADWGNWDAAHASELLRVETRRTIERIRLSGAHKEDELFAVNEELLRVESGVVFLPLDRAVLARASLPMPNHVATLDAIHLATAMIFREQRQPDLVFATHDAQLGRAARVLDFPVVGF